MRIVKKDQRASIENALTCFSEQETWKVVLEQAVCLRLLLGRCADLPFLCAWDAWSRSSPRGLQVVALGALP